MLSSTTGAQSSERKPPGVQAWPEHRTEVLPTVDQGLAYPGLRRAVNLAAAILLLVPAIPLGLVIAVLIKATSRGPVFYRQVRIGLDQRRPLPDGTVDFRRRQDLGGRPFTIVKFRTMVSTAEAQAAEVWASHQDPRVTWVGRYLRAYRLDELPQLINVLRGHMNLVGPRPEQPMIFATIRGTLPRYRERQRVLPGITGHAQVHLEYDSSLEDVRRKLDHDLEYLQRASAWEDLKIMIKTIPVMLFRRGGR